MQRDPPALSFTTFFLDGLYMQKVFPYPVDDKQVFTLTGKTLDRVNISGGESNVLWSLDTSKGAFLLPTAACSPDGKLVVMADSLKPIYVVGLGVEAKLVLQLHSEKCPTCIVFESADSFLVADRFGDVTRFRLDLDGSTTGQLRLKSRTVILGHVSIITDLAVGDRMGPEDTDLIVTADRDEKVRLTSSKEPHIIESFLLSHTEYVAAVLALPSRRRLLTVAGDGLLKLWNSVDGRLLDSLALPHPGRTVQIEKVVDPAAAADDLEEEEDAGVQVELVNQLIQEPLAMAALHNTIVYVAFDRSSVLLKISCQDDNSLASLGPIALPDDMQVASLCATPAAMCVTAISQANPKHAVLYVLQDDDTPQECYSLETEEPVDLERIWKGAMRKDCHRVFAKRLLKKRSAAAGAPNDIESDIDDE